jgi:hypothetical protein
MLSFRALTSIGPLKPTSEFDAYNSTQALAPIPSASSAGPILVALLFDFAPPDLVVKLGRVDEVIFIALNIVKDFLFLVWSISFEASSEDTLQ